MNFECIDNRCFNSVDCIKTNSLFREYDFVKNYTESVLIHSREIEHLVEMNFYKLRPPRAKEILGIFKKLKDLPVKVYEPTEHNFTVSDDGVLELGKYAARAMENIDDISAALDEFEKNPHWNKVRIVL